MVSLSSVISRLVLWTSTTGVSPVTVIVSCTPPTRMSASTVDDRRAADDQALALHRGEARQREGDGVVTGLQILDAVAARAVA